MEQWEKDEPYIYAHMGLNMNSLADEDTLEDGKVYVVGDGPLFPERPLTGVEKKYGQNQYKELVVCPRCVDAVPVSLLINDQDEVEFHCNKCGHYGHKDGTLIGIWKEDHIEFIKEG